MALNLLAYAVTLIGLVVIDLVWLLGPGRQFYVSEIGGLLRANPNLGAAAIFYLLYALGLTFFAVLPGMRAGSVLAAFGYGAFLGLVAYGTYDLTNLAVANGFTVRIAVIDMVWGTLLSGVVAAAASKLVSSFAN
jgi:uncharacterized membrane protein